MVAQTFWRNCVADGITCGLRLPCFLQGMKRRRSMRGLKGSRNVGVVDHAACRVDTLSGCSTVARASPHSVTPVMTLASMLSRCASFCRLQGLVDCKDCLISTWIAWMDAWNVCAVEYGLCGMDCGLNGWYGLCGMHARSQRIELENA